MGKEPYEPLIYNPHRGKPLIKHDDGLLVGCFMDIGMRNMAIRFSKYNLETREIEGISCKKFDFDLSKGNKDRKKLLEDRCDIGKSQDKYAQLTQEFYNLKESFSTCHYIVMEKQLGTAIDNIEASEYTLGLLTGLILDNGSKPIIIKLDSRVKTSMLKMPRGSDAKRWCLSKSFEILMSNKGDYDKKLSLRLKDMPVTGPNKSYDIADVVCYCEVFWRFYVSKSRIPLPSCEF